MKREKVALRVQAVETLVKHEVKYDKNVAYWWLCSPRKGDV